MKIVTKQANENVHVLQPVYITHENTVVSKPLPPITKYLIDQLILTKRFTKLSLAKELNISLVTINRWSAGSIKHPSHKIFSQLLKLYCLVQTEIKMIEEETFSTAVA